MKVLPKAVTKLIESFEKLPGIGPKTAQRLTFYLLHVPQAELDAFSGNIKDLKAQTVMCGVCKNIAETDPCDICKSPSRDHGTVCVVEQPSDVLSLERIGKFTGVYHVLHGTIDPLNNIGPDEIYIADLLKRIRESDVCEVILAMNPNMEGEATVMYITKELRSISETLLITRLAHGLPVGADIEYADEVTLSRALEGRRKF